MRSHGDLVDSALALQQETHWFIGFNGHLPTSSYHALPMWVHEVLQFAHNVQNNADWVKCLLYLTIKNKHKKKQHFSTSDLGTGLFLVSRRFSISHPSGFFRYK